MTFSHKQASEQIAELYGTYEENWEYTSDGRKQYSYFTQELGALMELAIRNKLDIMQGEISAMVVIESLDGFIEHYKDHNNDPIEATRVAITKALIKKA